MAFCLHYLRNKDTFFDVGANVGIYSLLASGHNGCQTIAFEPEEKTIEHLKRNISLNALSGKVKIIDQVVGEKTGQVRFSLYKDTINHVVKDSDHGTKSKEINMTNLDQYEILNPSIIKIDVEGYEWNVLNGAKSILNSADLDVIIIEINGSGRYFGIEDDSLHTFITSYGFNPYSYKPFKRELIPMDSYNDTNTIYIKNFEKVYERLVTGNSFETFGIII
jgi:FkbM family methyltransferase